MKTSRLPVVYEFNPNVDRIRTLLRKAGKKFGSVHFTKRKTGELRKMCYRLSVTNPSCALAPKGTRKHGSGTKKTSKLMTVLDANKVVRDRDGNKIGRGAWRNVPLDNVVEVSAGGVRYKIVK